jgi:hypothetical protein
MITFGSSPTLSWVVCQSDRIEMRASLSSVLQFGVRIELCDWTDGHGGGRIHQKYK